MISCEFEALVRGYQFIGRNYFRDTTGIQNVGIGAKVLLTSNQKTIPISIIQAIRIVRLGVAFFDTAETEDVTAGVGNLGIFKNAAGTPNIALVPSLNTAGQKFDAAGHVMYLEDELIYGTDLADVGFVGGPNILASGFIGALGGAAAHNITNTLWVMWDLYQLKAGMLADSGRAHEPGFP